MKYADTGLVIHGPWISTGKTGAGAHLGRNDAKLISYNVDKNIKHYVEQCSEIVGFVVVVLWENDRIHFEQSGLTLPSNVKVLFLPLASEDERRGGTNSTNNWMKQFSACAAGGIELRKRGCTRAMKIRSDLYVSSEALDKIINNWHKQASPICLLGHYTKEKMLRGYTNDMVFGARIELYNMFCSRMLASGIAIESIHLAFTRAFSETLCNAGYCDPKRVDWCRFGWGQDFFSELGAMLGQWSIIVNKEFMRDFVWRGEPFSSNYLNGLGGDYGTSQHTDLSVYKPSALNFSKNYVVDYVSAQHPALQGTLIRFLIKTTIGAWNKKVKTRG